jgi:hypothetical protein
MRNPIFAEVFIPTLSLMQKLNLKRYFNVSIPKTFHQVIYDFLEYVTERNPAITFASLGIPAKPFSIIEQRIQGLEDNFSSVVEKM